jgi:Chaperone of endosialidase
MERILLTLVFVFLTSPLYAQSTLYSNSSTGNVGVGTTSPAGTLDVEGGTAAASTNGSSINLVAQDAGTGNQNGGNIILTPGTATGTGAAGGIGIGTTSPTTLLHVAGIARANQFIIGETTDTYNGSIEITYDDATNYGIFFVDTNTALPPNAPVLVFERNAGVVGDVVITNTNTTYNTTSDRRLKENITDTSRGLQQLMQIPVHDFNFISDPQKVRQQGLIAQEVYKIYPEAVSAGGNDPKKKPWAIDYGRLTPLLLKAIQDQQKEIDELKQKIGQLTPKAK